MNIQLAQSEIEKAILLYVSNAGFDIENKQVKVEMTAGRKGNGHTAQVFIDSATDATSDDSDEDSDNADSDDKKLF